jgi:hypothetical protein
LSHGETLAANSAPGSGLASAAIIYPTGGFAMIRVLAVMGVGALAMYFFDPVSGRRRRALLRDRRNRAHGLVAEARRMAERRLGERRHASPLHVDPS